MFLVGLKPAIDVVVDEGLFVGGDIVEEYFFDRVFPAVHGLTAIKVYNNHRSRYSFGLPDPDAAFLLHAGGSIDEVIFAFNPLVSSLLRHLLNGQNLSADLYSVQTILLDQLLLQLSLLLPWHLLILLPNIT